MIVKLVKHVLFAGDYESLILCERGDMIMLSASAYISYILALDMATNGYGKFFLIALCCRYAAEILIEYYEFNLGGSDHDLTMHVLGKEMLE